MSLKDLTKEAKNDWGFDPASAWPKLSGDKLQKALATMLDKLYAISEEETKVKVATI